VAHATYVLSATTGVRADEVSLKRDRKETILNGQLDANRRTWQPVALLVLCGLGLGLALYTLWIHYQPRALVCVSGGIFNCGEVLKSAQSVIFGVPVPYFGVAFFVVMGSLCVPAAWRSPARWVHKTRLTLSICGMGMVSYLIWTELITLNAVCLWCTGVHIVTFAIFVIVVASTPMLLSRAE
jgi:uncharacterized membrane protein